MTDLSELEIWFAAGSQHLYGDSVLKTIDGRIHEIAQALAHAPEIPVRIVPKPVLASTEAIRQLCADASRYDRCIGLLLWMHTFSPAQMWIAGLNALDKPFAHLHTQFHRRLPWATLDMDFMNLNQSAHGDREFGFLTARMGLARKVIAGFWQDSDVIAEIAAWSRAAAGWREARRLRVARFGDNMRNVAVTEGDKVEARMRLGFAVEGYGVGDLAARIAQVGGAEVDRLVAEYDDLYEVAPSLRAGGERRSALREAAKIELGLQAFLAEGGFQAFTDTFEDLHGLVQLPGVAVQRLMAKGYGFGAEGDWKAAALVRILKVMSAGLSGGVSFMEDYTYDLTPPGQVLGAHMLEVCPSIAAAKPSLEIHPLAIGGKADPVRLVFTARSGPTVTASLVDLGHRFRLLVNEVDATAPPEPLPRLPVARALWTPRPSLKVAAGAWIYAGGSHHTAFTPALTAQHLADFAEIAGIECVIIDGATRLAGFQQALRWNEAYYSRGCR